jgi:transcriptional regulatory protein LevR
MSDDKESIKNEHLHRMLLSSLREVERYASQIDTQQTDIEDKVVEARVVASRISKKINDYLESEPTEDQ